MKNNTIKKIEIKNGSSKKLTTIWLVIGIFLVSTIYFTIQYSTLGAELTVLENEERKLVKENQELSAKIVRLQSLTQIKSTSEELGFAKPTETVYLNDTESLGFSR